MSISSTVSEAQQDFVTFGCEIFLSCPEVEGCTLTDGARALAKHVNRSSQKFWGNFHGSGEDLFEFKFPLFNF